MTLRLLTEHHLKFLNLKGGCKGSSESTLVKIPHFWKSHVVAYISFFTENEIDEDISLVTALFAQII